MMNHTTPFIRSVIAVAALQAGAAFALDIQLPAETAAYKPSSLPGYQLALRDCMTCHSAHYVQSQPSTSPRAYWEATVKKMKHPFGAQFADEDIAPIADYLVKTYGAEKGMATAAVTAAPQVIKVADKPEIAKGAVLDVQALMNSNGCIACHAVDKKIVGPSFNEVAAKYANQPDAITQVAHNIRTGGAGKWGPIPMPPFSALSEAEAQALARYVLAQ
jgi:cytochrome c551/c552